MYAKMGKKESYNDKEGLKQELERLRVLFDGMIQALVQTIPDVVYFKDAQCRTLVVNRAFEKLMGLTQKEIVGKTNEQLLPKDLAEQCRKSDEEVLRKRKTLRFEEQTIDKKGEKRFYETIKAPLYDGRGKVVGLVGVSRDITERKKAEDKRIRLSSAVKMSTDGIVVSDINTNIIEVNEAVLKMYGTDDKEDLIGKNSLDFVAPEDREKVLAGIKEVLEKGYNKGIEFHVISKDGSKIAVEMSSAIMKDVDGKPAGFVCIVRDITERKKAEDKISQQNEFLNNILESLTHPFYVIDANDYTVKIANSAAGSGVLSEKSTCYGFTHKRKKPCSAEHPCPLREVKKTKKPAVEEHIHYDKDGNKRIVEVQGYPIFDNDGNVVQMIEYSLDITKRKKAEKVLRESKEKYRTQFEEALDAIFVADAETGIIIDCNRAATELVGREKSELVGKHQRILHPPEDIEGEFSRTFKRHLKEKRGQVLEDRIITKNGEIKDVAIKANVFKAGNKRIIQGIFRDISERKKVQKALREAEEKYRKTILNANVGIIAYGPEGEVKVFNPKIEEMTGFKRSEVPTSVDWFEKLYPNEEERRKVRDKWLKRMSEGEVKEGHAVITTKEGKRRNFLFNSVQLESGDSFVFVHDITEQKKMEERLLESEERLRNLYENIPDSLAVFVGREGHLLECNKAFKKRTGYTDEELKDKKFLDFVHPEDRAMIREKYRTRYPEEDLPLVFELREINKKGEALPTEVSVSTYKKKGRVIGIEVMHRDITKRKEMEKKLQEYAAHLEEMVEERTKELKEVHEQLLKAERLAAIGELAAMVGHDLRNPLTGIAGATYYLKRKLGSKTKKKTREMLELIEKDIEHSNKIISDLLEYSRELRLELAETTPKTIVEEAFSLVEVPKNIQVLDSTQSEPKVKVDMEKIKRVFANLIKNAIEAMPKGGKLTLKTKETNGKLEIAFTDTGVGIPKNNLEKIGKPLFTTKSKGIGLGLSICKRIVEAHRGNISVESTVGKGTTFTVTIPIEPELEGGEKIWVKPLESSLLTTTKT